jgi:hypothetical protein
MVTESPLYPTFACNGFSSQGYHWISQRISSGNTDESAKLRGRETVLGFDAGKEDLRMRSVDKYSLSNKTKDGEPCALKGASTVRGGL